MNNYLKTICFESQPIIWTNNIMNDVGFRSLKTISNGDVILIEMGKKRF